MLNNNIQSKNEYQTLIIIIFSILVVIYYYFAKGSVDKVNSININGGITGVINSTGATILSNNSNATISDINMKFSATGSDYKWLNNIVNSGNLVINSGKIVTNGKYTRGIYNTGVLNINGGLIDNGNNSNTRCIQNYFSRCNIQNFDYLYISSTDSLKKSTFKNILKNYNFKNIVIPENDTLAQENFAESVNLENPIIYFKNKLIYF